MQDWHRKVLQFLKRQRKYGGATYREISEALDLPLGTVKRAVHDLRKQGFPISSTERGLFLEDHHTDNSRELRVDASRLKIGIVADTHIGSRHFDGDSLRKFYAEAEKEGVDFIVHAGDLLEGISVYRGQENDIKAWGVEEQVSLFEEEYPDSVNTVFILGNHDTSFLKVAGVDVGKLIEKARPDTEYIGRYQAEIHVGDGVIRLFHPDGGASYALSYRPQKFAVSLLATGKKTDLLVVGHLHEQLILHHAGTYIVLPGCFQRATDYITRKGLTPVIGGVIADIRFLNDGVDVMFRVRKYA